MALGGGAFGKWLGHEHGDLTNGISDFIKRPNKAPLSLLPWEIMGKGPPSMTK